LRRSAAATAGGLAGVTGVVAFAVFARALTGAGLAPAIRAAALARAGRAGVVRAAALAVVRAVLSLDLDFSFTTVTRRARTAGFARGPLVLMDRRTARAMREV